MWCDIMVFNWLYYYTMLFIENILTHTFSLSLNLHFLSLLLFLSSFSLFHDFTSKKRWDLWRSDRHNNDDERQEKRRNRREITKIMLILQKICRNIKVSGEITPPWHWTPRPWATKASLWHLNDNRSTNNDAKQPTW